jgi:5-methylcytosine-specific restriction protein A
MEMHGISMPENSWSGSDRRSRLPSNWTQLRAQTKARANGQCQALLNDGRRCPDQGTDCDHIVPGDNHELSNLQWLCKWHHGKKSSAEGNKGQRRRFTERHPTEKHPGWK